MLLQVQHSLLTEQNISHIWKLLESYKVKIIKSIEAQTKGIRLRKWPLLRCCEWFLQWKSIKSFQTSYPWESCISCVIMVDPEFPFRGAKGVPSQIGDAIQFCGRSRISQTGGSNPKDGGANLYFGQVFPKTAWKLKIGPKWRGVHPKTFPLRCAHFPEILQNFSECQILWSLCLVVFHALTLKLPIQTSLSVAPKFQVCVRSGEKCQSFSKTRTPQGSSNTIFPKMP